MKKILLALLSTFVLLNATETQDLDQKQFNKMFQTFVETSDNKVAQKLRKHPELVKKLDLEKIYQSVNKFKGKNLEDASVKKELKADISKKTTSKNTKHKKHKDESINPVDMLSVLVVIGLVNIFSGDFGK